MKKNKNSARVDILLATFNGMQYLPELLQSLEAQTFTNWKLIVRDDGSNDQTVALLSDWARMQPGKLLMIDNDNRRLGACGSFGVLLECSQAPYFMLCDQDDVWLPDKIERLLNLVRETEQNLSAATPIFAHSDLVVVDNNLQVVHKSLWRYRRLLTQSSRQQHERLILDNYVTGCASIGNAALRQAANPIPRDAIMHDWWLTLVAANFGAIVEKQIPTVLYRQHGNNTLGAQSWSFPGIIARFLRSPSAALQIARNHIAQTQQQAAAFVETFGDRLHPQMSSIMSEYAQLGSGNFVQRKSFFVRRRLWPNNYVRAAIAWWFI